MSVFRKDNIICIVHRENNESLQHFYERGTFIVNQKPKNDKEYNKCVIYSNIFINSKYLKCEYDSNIMKELTTMITNMSN